jgi:hypothetical protein
VINTLWDIIAEAHNIVNMSMYVRKFVAKEFSYLLANDNTNVAIDVDDDDETQLTDSLLINSFLFPSLLPFQIDCACAGCFLQKGVAPFVGVCYFYDYSFESPSICDLLYDHDPLHCSNTCGEVFCPDCITTEALVPHNRQCIVCIQHTCHLSIYT